MLRKLARHILREELRGKDQYVSMRMAERDAYADAWAKQRNLAASTKAELERVREELEANRPLAKIWRDLESRALTEATRDPDLRLFVITRNGQKDEHILREAHAKLLARLFRHWCLNAKDTRRFDLANRSTRVEVTVPSVTQFVEICQ